MIFNINITTDRLTALAKHRNAMLCYAEIEKKRIPVSLSQKRSERTAERQTQIRPTTLLLDRPIDAPNHKLSSLVPILGDIANMDLDTRSTNTPRQHILQFRPVDEAQRQRRKRTYPESQNRSSLSQKLFVRAAVEAAQLLFALRRGKMPFLVLLPTFEERPTTCVGSPIWIIATTVFTPRQ